tara:strand:- start:1802 stop:3484 length:1683 start_codon:yes stop_codon:yes gene_type:complete
MGKYGKTITDAYQEVLEWTVTAHKLQEKKKVSKREIDKLEDDNEHGMVALKLAQSFGTPKEVKTVQDINKRHQRAGSIEYKDQKERDAIIRKYYNMAEVYEIGTKEYADHTKNMTPGQTVDEGKMKDIVTDVKDALGKIRHRVSQKGSKFMVSVDQNDEEDAQKAMRNHPLYVAGKLRVIPEDVELDEKKQLKPKAKFDFDLFSDMKGAKEAEADLNKELHKAARMKDKKSAVAHMRKIQNKYMKFGATDTEPSMTIGTVLDAIFENKEIAELKKIIELDEMFDYVLLDKDNKIVGRYSGKDAKKNAQSDKNSAHLPPMRIPKGEVSKMKVYPISPKDKKGIGDMVLAIGEELELTEKVSKDLAIKILSMNKNQKFAKISGDFVPEIYLSSSDKDSLKKEFGRLPRGLPSASSGIPVVDFINYALGLDNEIDTEGDGNAPKLYDYRKGKVIGKPKTVGDAARIAGVRLTEKKLTDAEMKKREEIAKAIEKDNPDMPMDKKMAIATATAKRVAEEEEPNKPDTAKKVDQMRDDKKKTRIAQLQLQIAKATETINKLNTQEK